MNPDLLKHPVYGNPEGPQYPKVLRFMEDSANLFEVLKKVKPKIVFNSDIVFTTGPRMRAHLDHEKWALANGIGNLCDDDPSKSLCYTGMAAIVFNNVPTYTRNVKVVTHEMGHVLGSYHTHACRWGADGMTAIDNCGRTASRRGGYEKRVLQHPDRGRVGLCGSNRLHNGLFLSGDFPHIGRWPITNPTC